MPIRQSVCLPILPPMDRDELLEQIAAIGYPAVEIWERCSIMVETACAVICKLSAIRALDRSGPRQPAEATG